MGNLSLEAKEALARVIFNFSPDERFSEHELELRRACLLIRWHPSRSLGEEETASRVINLVENCYGALLHKLEGSPAC